MDGIYYVTIKQSIWLSDVDKIFAIIPRNTAAMCPKP